VSLTHSTSVITASLPRIYYVVLLICVFGRLGSVRYTCPPGSKRFISKESCRMAEDPEAVCDS